MSCGQLSTYAAYLGVIKVYRGAGDGAQLIECMPTVHKFLDSIPHYPASCGTYSTWKVKAGRRKFSSSQVQGQPGVHEASKPKPNNNNNKRILGAPMALLTYTSSTPRDLVSAALNYSEL